MTRGKMNERGASAVEYGLIVALLAAAVIGGLSILTVSVTTAGECVVLFVKNDRWTPADPEWTKYRACHDLFIPETS